MKIFKDKKFINRFTQNPRKLFEYSKRLSMDIWCLDIIFKLLNFNHFDENKANLTNISDRSWTSIRTFQRSLKKLDSTGLIKIQRNKDNKWKYTTNTYDLSWVFVAVEKISDEEKQLSLFEDSSECFWKKSSTLGSLGMSFSPRVLDFFQKELDITQSENVFIKYILWFTDDKWITEISLNYTAKTTPFTRSSLTKIISSLEKKWLLSVKEQFCAKTWYRVRNRYDINPLMQKLNELERKKVEKKLKSQWKWKDYNSNRKSKPIDIIIKEEGSDKSKIDSSIKNERINFLHNEICRLQRNLSSKYSEEADLIRQYQKELSDLKYKKEKSFSELIKERVLNAANNNGKVWNNDLYRAKDICLKLNWSWDKSRNFYIKAIKLFPNSVDRHVVTSIEKAKFSKERYFLRTVSNLFKKLEQKT